MINFNFGKKKPDKRELIKVSIIVSLIIAALSQCTGVSEDGLWDLLDELQRKYFPQTTLNQIIIQDPNKVERRIKRDVDAAINKYLTETPQDPIIPKPRFIQKEPDGSEAQKLLGGEMRLCSPWVDSCPKD
ncbi:hypothetical protein [Synechococcus phage DSL-LC03]|nr:hypothetical protein [Synechococcus phage DSL-LC03]